jgi:hypothetical protein
VSMTVWSPTFRWNVVPLSSRISRPRRFSGSFVLGHLTLEDEVATFLRNVGNHSPNNTVSRPRRLEVLSGAPLIEPEILQIIAGCVKTFELVEFVSL